MTLAETQVEPDGRGRVPVKPGQQAVVKLNQDPEAGAMSCEEALLSSTDTS